MRALSIVVLILTLNAFIPQPPGHAEQTPSPNNTGICAASASNQMRTTLYFGLSHPSGSISESQWQAFLRNEVTPRFPNGLTVWEANGQWRRADGHIGRERAKVLLLVHEENASVRSAIADIVGVYKRAFRQESVLWETAPVCAAF
jgi:hypothetical protein